MGIRIMNNFQLKIIAIILMTIDHIGFILFPDIIILRVIGRLSFPIFVFLIIEGFKNTSNYNSFLKRLISFAVIIEIPNLILNYSNSMNIFFTLATGLIVVKLLDDGWKITNQKKEIIEAIQSKKQPKWVLG